MRARSPHLPTARRIVREVIAVAETRGATAREARRLFRARQASTSIPLSVWYAAVRAETGGGLLDLPDYRQPTLLDRGPRARRSRKKTANAAA